MAHLLPTPSTGTSAFDLHLSIVSALVTNAALRRYAPSVGGEGFTVPFLVGLLVTARTLFLGAAH